MSSRLKGRSTTSRRESISGRDGRPRWRPETPRARTLRAKTIRGRDGNSPSPALPRGFEPREHRLHQLDQAREVVAAFLDEDGRESQGADPGAGRGEALPRDSQRGRGVVLGAVDAE